MNTSHEDMVKYLVEKHRINPLVIDESGIHADYGDTQIDVSGDPRRVTFERSGPVYITGTRFIFHVPFTGDSELFKCQPSTYRLNRPKAIVREEELVLTYDVTKEEVENIREKLNGDLQVIQEHAQRISQEAEKFNLELPINAARELNARREKLLQDRDIVESIGFPLRRRENPPSTFVTPDVKRKIVPQKPTPSLEPFSPEPTLGIHDYEHIISTLLNMATVMERSPRAFRNMNEEDLRTHFLVQLNGQYEGQATGETFNYEGKTDILIRSGGRNIFIAECKFWTGSAGLKETLDQLLGYTAWRDTKAAILVFNRDTNTSTVLERIPETVREHPNHKSGEVTNLETGFRYTFGHRDDENREITITILVFDIPK